MTNFEAGRDVEEVEEAEREKEEESEPDADDNEEKAAEDEEVREMELSEVEGWAEEGTAENVVSVNAELPPGLPLPSAPPVVEEVGIEEGSELFISIASSPK